jgi:hypothetical protein
MVPAGRAEMQSSHDSNRRHRLRFDMSFPVLLRTIGGPWEAGVSKTVSVDSTFLLTNSPFLLNADAEWVLRLPPELTKTEDPLILRFYGTVLRCEHVRERDSSFGITLQSRGGYRYVPQEEAAKFGAMFAKLGPAD